MMCQASSGCGVGGWQQLAAKCIQAKSQPLSSFGGLSVGQQGGAIFMSRVLAGSVDNAAVDDTLACRSPTCLFYPGFRFPQV
jgi:hypothetical protein